MNEKLQYATMLEIPVNTCSVTYAPIKKKKKNKKKAVNHEVVKQELLTKINSDLDEKSAELYQSDTEQVYQEISEQESFAPETENTEIYQNKKPKKFSVIGLQLCIIGILVAGIFLTNAFYPTSGINVFMREIFGGEKTPTVSVDERLYSEFAPVITLSDGAVATAEEGVISIAGEGSIYAPVSGIVSAFTKSENGKYNIEITHSENFKTLISGIDYAYVGLDDEVFFNIPVGYTELGDVTLCFTGEDGASITDYQLTDNSVVWAV